RLSFALFLVCSVLILKINLLLFSTTVYIIHSYQYRAVSRYSKGLALIFIVVSIGFASMMNLLLLTFHYLLIRQNCVVRVRRVSGLTPNGKVQTNSEV